jgi:hypothetical protein
MRMSFPKARYRWRTLDNETYSSTPMGNTVIKILKGTFVLGYNTRAQFPSAKLLSNGFKSLDYHLHCRSLAWIIVNHIVNECFQEFEPLFRLDYSHKQ